MRYTGEDTLSLLMKRGDIHWYMMVYWVRVDAPTHQEDIVAAMNVVEGPRGDSEEKNSHGGGGFLDDVYPEAAKAIWDFEGIFCSSRQ